MKQERVILDRQSLGYGWIALAVQSTKTVTIVSMGHAHEVMTNLMQILFARHDDTLEYISENEVDAGLEVHRELLSLRQRELMNLFREMAGKLNLERIRGFTGDPRLTPVIRRVLDAEGEVAFLDALILPAPDLPPNRNRPIVVREDEANRIVFAIGELNALVDAKRR